MDDKLERGLKNFIKKTKYVQAIKEVYVDDKDNMIFMDPTHVIRVSVKNSQGKSFAEINNLNICNVPTSMKWNSEYEGRQSTVVSIDCLKKAIAILEGCDLIRLTVAENYPLGLFGKTDIDNETIAIHIAGRVYADEEAKDKVWGWIKDEKIDRKEDE